MTGIFLTLIDSEEDKRKFESLYKSQRERLFRIAYKRLGDHHLAEDALSEAFLYISRKFTALSALLPEQLEAYCCIAVRNICNNMLRNRTEEIYTDGENVQGDEFINNEALRYTDNILLRDAIAKLRYEERELLMLVYFYRFSTREIADFKKIRQSSVQKRLQRARGRLKMLIDEGKK